MACAPYFCSRRAACLSQQRHISLLAWPLLGTCANNLDLPLLSLARRSRRPDFDQLIARWRQHQLAFLLEPCELAAFTSNNDEKFQGRYRVADCRDKRFTRAGSESELAAYFEHKLARLFRAYHHRVVEFCRLFGRRRCLFVSKNLSTFFHNSSTPSPALSQMRATRAIRYRTARYPTISMWPGEE